ncbi:MAG TPA: methyltransferase domain-containing protein [Pyrinomonadaceae bacterium]|jgi:SAM-dependent methyltransferase
MNDREKSEKPPNWDERYASGKYSAAEPHRLLISLVEKTNAGKALDLACGAGRNAIFLAENGWLVTAIDNSKVGIEIARARAAEKGVAIDFRAADLEAGQFEIEANAYDLICDFYYLQRDLFAEMKKGVKPGGVVAAAIHIYGENERAGRFTLREGELKEYFADFEILHYHETAATDRDAGEHHRRTAEMVARKGKTVVGRQ